jgi:hypothetical protein
MTSCLSLLHVVVDRLLDESLFVLKLDQECHYYVFLAVQFNALVLLYGSAVPYRYSLKSFWGIKAEHIPVLVWKISVLLRTFYKCILAVATKCTPTSLFKKPCVTQEENTRVTENSVNHIDWETRSMLITDFSDRSTWMTEFSVTLVMCPCVKLGNSAETECVGDCTVHCKYAYFKWFASLFAICNHFLILFPYTLFLLFGL